MGSPLSFTQSPVKHLNFDNMRTYHLYWDDATYFTASGHGLCLSKSYQGPSVSTAAKLKPSCRKAVNMPRHPQLPNRSQFNRQAGKLEL